LKETADWAILLAMETLIRPIIRILVCVTVLGVTLPSATAQNAQLTKYYAAKCKQASFARNPAGTMATTIRNLAIARCIKNKGYLD
jgi:hypothetical protein